MQFEHYGVTLSSEGEPIDDDYAAAVIERGIAMYGDGLVHIRAEVGVGYIYLFHYVCQPFERLKLV